MRPTSRTARLGLVAAVAFTIAGCTSAPMTNPNMVVYGGTLTGAAEVPPNPSTATGTLDASLDKTTGMFKWRVTYTGLSGPATAAHFHGPAMAGANAGVVLPFASPVSPIEGQGVLTAEQRADLQAGKWYVNVHSQRYPGGEIRAQVVPK